MSETSPAEAAVFDPESAPELYAMYVKQMGMPGQVRAKHGAFLRSKRIIYPDWTMPYLYAPDPKNRVCSFHNHTSGKGCKRGKECVMRHVCAVCGAKSHGVFMTRPDGKPMCATRRAWDRQLAFAGWTLDEFELSIGDDLWSRETGAEPTGGKWLFDIISD